MALALARPGSAVTQRTFSGGYSLTRWVIQVMAATCFGDSTSMTGRTTTVWAGRLLFIATAIWTSKNYSSSQRTEGKVSEHA
jgi:hypothetical protein